MICAFWGALLTNGLCRRENGEPGPLTPTFRHPLATPRLALPSLASCKNRVLWAFFAVLMEPVNRQQLSVAHTCLPKYVLEHRPLVNATHENRVSSYGLAGRTERRCRAVGR